MKWINVHESSVEYIEYKGRIIQKKRCYGFTIEHFDEVFFPLLHSMYMQRQSDLGKYKQWKHTNERTAKRTNERANNIKKTDARNRDSQKKTHQTKKQNGEEKHKTRKIILTILWITQNSQCRRSKWSRGEEGEERMRKSEKWEKHTNNKHIQIKNN